MIDVLNSWNSSRLSGRGGCQRYPSAAEINDLKRSTGMTALPQRWVLGKIAKWSKLPSETMRRKWRAGPWFVLNRLPLGRRIDRMRKARNGCYSDLYSGMLAVFAAAIIVLVSITAKAQQEGKLYRIGWLSASAINATFRSAMRDLGYVEGKNLVFEYRQAKQPKNYPGLARELVRLQVDLLFTVGVSATRAARDATSAIPIVMGNSSADPVRQGLIESLSKPGGNVTGVFDLLPDLAGKRVEIIKEIFPKLSRIAHIAPESPVSRAHVDRVREAAGGLGVEVQTLTVNRPHDLEGAFRAAAGADVAIVVGVSFFIPHRSRIVRLAANYRVPAMYTHTEWVPEGGLVAYTTDSHARYRRAAWYVDQIFKGAAPADLPAEQPKKFLLEVNLKTARVLGIAIPQSILLRATKMIE